MTLQAVEPIRVTIPRQDWPEPGTPERCQLCPSRLGLQWHHIIRRSATGGPVDWVEIDGLVLWNKLRVCLHCHDRINNHHTWIRYEKEEGWTVWGRMHKTEQARGRWIQHPKSQQWFTMIGVVKV